MEGWRRDGWRGGGVEELIFSKHDVKQHFYTISVGSGGLAGPPLIQKIVTVSSLPVLMHVCIDNNNRKYRHPHKGLSSGHFSQLGLACSNPTSQTE